MTPSNVALHQWCPLKKATIGGSKQGRLGNPGTCWLEFCPIENKQVLFDLTHRRSLVKESDVGGSQFRLVGVQRNSPICRKSPGWTLARYHTHPLLDS